MTVGYLRIYCSQNHFHAYDKCDSNTGCQATNSLLPLEYWLIETIQTADGPQQYSMQLLTRHTGLVSNGGT